MNANATPEMPDRPWLRSEALVCLALALVILFFAAVRFRLRQMPLERDEGEYAYAGQLILQGIPPYQLAYNMKLPGTYVAYAVVMAIFGQTPAGIREGLIFVNAITAILVYMLGKKLSGIWTGLASAISYLLLSTSQSVLGLEGHATHFVTLFAVAGALTLVLSGDRQKSSSYFFAGLFFGISFVMKQPGASFLLFGAFYIFMHEPRPLRFASLLKRMAIYTAGGVLPFLVVCLWMVRSGLFARFWFWTVSYARQYGSSVPLREGLQDFSFNAAIVIGTSAVLWILAALGLTRRWWSSTEERSTSFYGAFTFFSFLAVCPGLYFRPHYFIVLLPAVALLIGVALVSASEYLSGHLRFAPAVVFVVACVFSVTLQSKDLFRLAPASEIRRIYASCPFNEVIPIADYIRKNSRPDAKIAVLGSEPEIYFYAQRHSATGYIYMYPMTEEQPYAPVMEREMISEIERSRPEFLVFVGMPTSWALQKNSNSNIFRWLESYVPERYDYVGLVNVADVPQYYWGPAAAEAPLASHENIRLFRLKAQQ